MRTTLSSMSSRLLAKALLLALAAIAPAWAQDEAGAEPPQSPAIEAPDEQPRPDVELERDDASETSEAAPAPQPPATAEETAEVEESSGYGIHNAEIVRVGEDVHLAKGDSANTIVSIFGSATSEGEVHEDIVAVFGDTYVDGRVGGDAVAVFGDLELGPNAVVGGEAVVISGELMRHPGAVIHGSVQEFGQFKWIRPWLQHALLLGRPLALEPGLQWAWALAFGFLGLYVLISLLFGGAVEKCVKTLEDRPGETAVASIITIFLSPIFMVLLAITIVGAIFVPFFVLACFVAGLFGKAVVLAAIGRRVTRVAHVAVATLIGGLIVLALYLLPVLGFILFALIAILGLGVVAYTLLLAARARTSDAPVPAASSAGGLVGQPPASMTMNEAPASAGVDGVEGAAASAPSESPAVAAPLTALPRASFWVRMGALAIDAILIGVIANFIPGSGDTWLLLLAIYGAIMWKQKGTTIGGIICNLRIVRVDGREVDWTTSIVRALGCFLSLAAVGLGFIWIGLDPERQAWHDKIAGTLVVRTPKGTPLV